MKFTVVLILLLSSFDLIAQKDIKLTSPSKQLSFSFHNGREGLFYNISFKNKRIINNSSISLDFIDGKFKQNLKAGKPVFRKGVEDYELIVGKAKFVHDPYLEVLIPLEETKTPFRKFNIVVRAFDDGIAFRYEFPQQPSWSQFSLTDEHTTFNLAENPKILALLPPSYTTLSGQPRGAVS